MLATFRTAPRLLQDLLTFDPCPKNSGIDLEVPCSHIYTVLDGRSNFPEPNRREAQWVEWKTVAICRECRSHITLVVTYQQSNGQRCPNKDYPLHHFKTVGRTETEDNTYESCFVCTSPVCKVEVVARLRAPTLQLGDVTFLTDQSALRARAQATQERYPEMQDRNAVQTLITFRSYVSHAIENRDDRQIPAANKFFMFTLGHDAHELLTRLGFSLASPNKENEYFWNVPKPAQHPNQTLEIRLQDVEDELTVLMQGRPESEKEVAIEMMRGRPDSEKQVVMENLHPPPGSIHAMEWVLGTWNYEKSYDPNRELEMKGTFANKRIFGRGFGEKYRIALIDSENSSYQAIGAVSDFADGLVSFSYDRQAIWDPLNTPQYLQSLQDIATTRQSEDLQNKVAMLKSQGFATAADLEELYGYFSVEKTRISDLSEDQLIERFNCLHEDSGPDEKSRARETLHRIGIATNSSRLRAIATQNVDTYDDALAFLDPDARHDIDDDFVLSLAQTKINESRGDLLLVRRTVEIISKQRPHSAKLRTWLESDDSQDSQLKEAYLLLGIEHDNPSSLDDDVVLSHFFARIDESPHVRQLQNTLSIIANRRGSTTLADIASQLAENSTASAEQPVSLNDPRGIRNIGNTCYLNSLLQYFFTVKPVRELVENIEQHKQQTSTRTPLIKKVGGDKINKQQVSRAHHFVRELNGLFQSLMTDHEPCVVPNEELARLTLKVVASSTIRSRTSNESARRPSQGLASPASAMDKTKSANIVADGIEAGETDEAEVMKRFSTSQHTSKDGDVMVEGILAKTQSLSTKDMNSSEHAILENQSSSDSHEQLLSEEPMQLDEEASKSVKYQTNGIQAPGQPPPIPPRPQAKEIQAEYEEFAQQQDVQEVIENVLYLLRWATKAEAYESNGEQVDLISRMFFGKLNTVNFNAEDEKIDVAPFSYLIIYPRSGFDIYDAMDESWYESELEVDNSTKSQFNTIKEIPPILQFYIPRVRFNKEEGQMFKDMSQLHLLDDIFMDRYMDDADMITKRRQSWSMKKHVCETQAKRDRMVSKSLTLSMPEALRATQKYFTDLNTVDDGEDMSQDICGSVPLQKIEEVAKDIQSELDRLHIQLSDLKTDLLGLFGSTGNLKYRLHAVFIHAGGSATGGHWFIYIRDAKDARDGIWRKYNDETVSMVGTSSMIYEPEPQQNEMSAFVVYVRDENQSQLVETICRIPAPQADPPEPISDSGASDLVPHPDPYHVTRVGNWDNSGAW